VSCCFVVYILVLVDKVLNAMDYIIPFFVKVVSSDNVPRKTAKLEDCINTFISGGSGVEYYSLLVFI